MEGKTLIGSMPTYIGEYEAGREYQIDNVVTSAGNAYISLKDGNTSALYDTASWAVFVQGFNGLLAEAAVGKQQIVTAVAGCGVEVGENPTYNELAEKIRHDLAKFDELDYFQKLGYDDEDLAFYREQLELVEDLKATWEAVKSNTWLGSYNKNAITIIPKVDTSEVTDMQSMFANCGSLQTIPQLDTSKVTDMGNMFYGCGSLQTIPQLDTSKVTDMGNMFRFCGLLLAIPPLDTSNVMDMNSLFSICESLQTVQQIDASNASNMSGMFMACSSLVTCNIKNLKISLSIQWSSNLSPASVAYIVSHAANTSAITITLHATAYAAALADADVQAALEAHPLVTLASV